MDQNLDGVFVTACDEATSLLSRLPSGDTVLHVLRALHKRVSRGCTLVRDIPRHWPDSFDAEMCCLLRVAYDGSLQALYIAHDRSNAPDLAKDYCEFEWVEKAKLLRIAEKSESPLAIQLRCAPSATVEATVRAQMDAAAQRFTKPSSSPARKDEVPENWYRKSLYDIANELGYRDEYDYVIRCLHTAVHCTPLGTLHEAPVEEGLVEHLSWALPTRVLAAATRYARIPLTELTSSLFDAAMRPFGEYIREGMRADIPLLVKLIRQSFYGVAERLKLTYQNCPSHPAFISEANVAEGFDKSGRFFIAEQSGTPCGCVGLVPNKEGVYSLVRLAVLPEYRCRGVGTALVRRVLQEAYQLKLSKIDVGIVASEIELQQLYERCGFRSVETRRFNHLPFDVTLMVCELKVG